MKINNYTKRTITASFDYCLLFLGITSIWYAILFFGLFLVTGKTPSNLYLGTKTVNQDEKETSFGQRLKKIFGLFIIFLLCFVVVAALLMIFGNYLQVLPIVLSASFTSYTLLLVSLVVIPNLVALYQKKYWIDGFSGTKVIGLDKIKIRRLVMVGIFALGVISLDIYETGVISKLEESILPSSIRALEMSEILRDKQGQTFEEFYLGE